MLDIDPRERYREYRISLITGKLVNNKLNYGILLTFFSTKLNHGKY